MLADRAIQAIIAMQKHQENETLLSLGALVVTANEGDKRNLPIKDVSVWGYAAFSTPCQWDLSLKSIRPFVSPDWK